MEIMIKCLIVLFSYFRASLQTMYDYRSHLKLHWFELPWLEAWSFDISELWIENYKCCTNHCWQPSRLSTVVSFPSVFGMFVINEEPELSWMCYMVMPEIQTYSVSARSLTNFLGQGSTQFFISILMELLCNFIPMEYERLFVCMFHTCVVVSRKICGITCDDVFCPPYHCRVYKSSNYTALLAIVIVVSLLVWPLHLLTRRTKGHAGKE